MVPAAAETQSIQGCYYGEEVVVDGKLDEAPWIMRDRVGTAASNATRAQTAQILTNYLRTI